MRADRQTLALRRRFTRQFYRSNRGTFLLALLAAVLLAVGDLFVSWLMQQIMDVASGASGTLTLAQIGLLCGATVIAFVLAMLLDYSTRPRFIKRAMRQYKDYAFEEITKKSISTFSGESTATYLSALTNDATSIESNYLAKVFTLVQEFLLFLGAFAMMLAYSPLLTLAAFALSLFPVIASMLTGNRLATQEKLVSDQNESFMGRVKDVLTGFSVVKSFKAEREMLRLFAQSNEIAEEAKCKRRKIEIVIQTIGLAAGIIAQFGVFLFGAYLALSGQGVTVGMVIVFVQLMNYVINPIASVPQNLANRKAANALIDKLAAAVYANVRREGKAVDNKLDTALELDDVRFAYEGGAPVLQGVSARFEAGKSYAIVGGSGSGKSTLLNLMIGGSAAYGGEIRYDGDELRAISSDSLYELVSIVQQSVFVFNSTIRDNITLFKDFDEAKLQCAIEMSGLSQMIAERGADYPCGENGSGLSGGERQRLSIARCLLRETPVLLVDEATAALDAATAFAVSSSILDITGLTRIVVTHRLEEALLKRYDGILVMRNGKVAESGRFDELMDKKGYFYSLYTVSQ